MFGKNSAKKVLQIITSRRTLIAIVALGLFLYSDSALAQATYNSLVTIPGIGSNPGILGYLRGLYSFLISVVGIVAMGAIVIGGARYLTSVGNPSAIEDAKHTIYSAIYGLILALVSWVLIGTINPDILVLKNPAMPWEAVGYSPGASDPLEMCDGPGSFGDGTVDNPCHCIDNLEVAVYASANIPANITLTSPADGASAAVGTSVTLAGKLTDASGNPVANTNIRVYVINDGVGIDGIRHARIQTNASGIFSILSSLPTDCADGVKLQAVFPEADPYSSTSFVASSVVNFTATGVPACVATNYPLHPAKIFVSGKLACKDICSNPILASDGLYHCMKADLRAGVIKDPNAPKSAINKDITIQAGETLFFDGDTYSIHGGIPLIRYVMEFENTFLGVIVADYGCSTVLNACVAPFFPLSNCTGKTEHTYSTAGTYKAHLTIHDASCHSSKDYITITVK